MSADFVPSSKINIFQSKQIDSFTQLSPLETLLVLPNRQTLGESASLPQSLGCNTVFDMRLRVTFLCRKTVSLQSNIAHRVYFHSSQCRLISYHHQRSIFFKANSIHSSIVAILELIRGAQCLIEVIRSSGKEM
jgi:hypothetical protein